VNNDDQIHGRVQRILERARVREQRRQTRRARRPSAGLPFAAGGPGALRPRLLVAEGDSWFDYPGTDVLEELEEVYDFDIESVAHHGDTVESMAYGDKQLDGLNRKLTKLAARNATPFAVLLSGGGNDIAGSEFVILLNHARSGLEVVNDDVVRGLIDVRLRAAYISLIRTVGGLCDIHFGVRDTPVVVHGYDYPVPDGRGFWGGWGPLPGPWLRPGFRRKGHLDLGHNTGVMKALIDRLNNMLATLSDEPDLQHVSHIDLRNTLSNDLAGDLYKDSWDNELHPEDSGFEAVADRFNVVLDGLPASGGS